MIRMEVAISPTQSIVFTWSTPGDRAKHVDIYLAEDQDREADRLLGQAAKNDLLAVLKALS